MCNKIGFNTRAEAKAWARSVKARGGSNMRPYECVRCPLWHLTAKYTAPVERALARRRRAA